MADRQDAKDAKPGVLSAGLTADKGLAFPLPRALAKPYRRSMVHPAEGKYPSFHVSHVPRANVVT